MKTRQLILIVGGAFIGGLFGAYHEIDWYGAILSALLFAYTGLYFGEMVNAFFNLYHSVVDLRKEESLEFLKADTTTPPAYHDAVRNCDKASYKKNNNVQQAIELDVINPPRSRRT